MTAPLIVLALCVAAVIGSGVPVTKYPAGVDPHACPNYPYCDNVALAAHSAGNHGAVAHYAAPAYAAYGRHGVAVHGAGAKYPAGVSPHTCPNCPYCGPTPVHRVYGAPGYGFHGLARGHGWAGAPVYGYELYAEHHGAGARYPAAVDPHTCPNYPYCHH